MSWMNARYLRTCWADKKHYTSSRDKMEGPGIQSVCEEEQKRGYRKERTSKWIWIRMERLNRN